MSRNERRQEANELSQSYSLNSNLMILDLFWLLQTINRAFTSVQSRQQAPLGRLLNEPSSPAEIDNHEGALILRAENAQVSSAVRIITLNIVMDGVTFEQMSYALSFNVFILSTAATAALQSREASDSAGVMVAPLSAYDSIIFYHALPRFNLSLQQIIFDIRREAEGIARNTENNINPAGMFLFDNTILNNAPRESTQILDENESVITQLDDENNATICGSFYCS